MGCGASHPEEPRHLGPYRNRVCERVAQGLEVETGLGLDSLDGQGQKDSTAP